MNEELISSENLLGAVPDPASSLENEFIRPAYTFAGRVLWPYTEGVDLVLRQIHHEQDNGMTRALKFIFVLWKRGAETMEQDFIRYVIPLAWRGQDEIHLELFKWTSENIRTDADKLAAFKLYDEIRAAAQGAAVDVVPQPGKKKAAASSRPKRRSSSRSSRNNPAT
jgi:hypothetical protein